MFLMSCRREGRRRCGEQMAVGENVNCLMEGLCEECDWTYIQLARVFGFPASLLRVFETTSPGSSRLFRIEALACA